MRRALAAYVFSAVCVAGIPAVAAAVLTTSGAALAATTSQCQPLPSTGTPSPTAIQVQLCVSVQNSQSSITTGQAASYTVQVWAANGSASGVSVTLTGSPSGEQPAFTGRCPSGDGSATCTIGSLATALAPSTYQMEAQIPVAAGASVTSVTLTATADAATSPAMSVLPAAAVTIAVTAPTAAASTPAASRSQTVIPSPSAPAPNPVLAPGAATPTAGPAAVTGSGASTSVFSPAGVAGVLPPTAAPAVDTPVSSAVGTGTPSAGGFTLVITTGTVELLGLIVGGLVFLLGGTRLARRWLAERKAPGGTVTKRRRFPPLWPPSRWRAAPGEGSAAGTRAGDLRRRDEP